MAGRIHPPPPPPPTRPPIGTRSALTTQKPDYDPPSQKNPNIPRGEIGEIRPRTIAAVDDIVDQTERQLWCSVYVERMRLGALPEDAPTSWDLADQAVAEYRKRYGADRVG